MAEFELAARNSQDRGIVAEFWHLLRDNRKWWLLPILAILLIFGTLIFLSGTAAAPFIYTIF